METVAVGDDVTVTLTPRETRKFAERWPCARTRGREVWARFSGGDLVDLEVDGERVDVPAHELNALVARYVGTPRPTIEDI